MTWRVARVEALAARQVCRILVFGSLNGPRPAPWNGARHGACGCRLQYSTVQPLEDIPPLSTYCTCSQEKEDGSFICDGITPPATARSYGRSRSVQRSIKSNMSYPESHHSASELVSSHKAHHLCSNAVRPHSIHPVLSRKCSRPSPPPHYYTTHTSFRVLHCTAQICTSDTNRSLQ